MLHESLPQHSVNLYDHIIVSHIDTAIRYVDKTTIVGA